MWRGDPSFAVVLIVFIVFCALAAVPIMIGRLIYYNARKRREADLIRLSIEKGMPVPDFTEQPSYYATLKSGLVWIAVGIGLILMIAIDGDEGYSGISLGFIPILIGIALCISWKLESGRDAKRQLPSNS
jgi:hypothetical protein